MSDVNPREPVKLDCGHMSTPSAIWPGYGVRATDGARLCSECCAGMDRESLARGEPVGAYLAGDMSAVTTWPGVVLAQVTWTKKLRVQSNWGYVYAFRAMDHMGRRFYGRGGPGMHCLLRPMKGGV